MNQTDEEFRRNPNTVTFFFYPIALVLYDKFLINLCIASLQNSSHVRTNHAGGRTTFELWQSLKGTGIDWRSRSLDNLPASQLFTAPEPSRALDSFLPRNAPGPDSFNPDVFLIESAALVFSFLFSTIFFRSGHFPRSWKVAELFLFRSQCKFCEFPPRRPTSRVRNRSIEKMVLHDLYLRWHSGGHSRTLQLHLLSRTVDALY